VRAPALSPCSLVILLSNDSFCGRWNSSGSRRSPGSRAPLAARLI